MLDITEEFSDSERLQYFSNDFAAWRVIMVQTGEQQISM